MIRVRANNLEWLQFELLAEIPHLHHAVFSRKGGSSQGPFESLNTSFTVGDESVYVQKNIASIQSTLKSIFPEWRKGIYTEGVHKDYLEEVSLCSQTEIKGCDGLLTKTPGISLMVKHADCQVGIFYDPMTHSLAVVHAGWIGSALNIYSKAIAKMKALYGSKPANLLVCISPSLGPASAEFKFYRKELPEEFWQFQISPLYFDFWQISAHQLYRAGILPHHLQIAQIDTYTHTEDFFSYRRNKITGRNTTTATLK